MTPIPGRIKKLLRQDPLYTRCCYCGKSPVQWHHSLYYGRDQIQEVFAIVPACSHCHEAVDNKLEMRHYFQYVAIRRATQADYNKYYKNDWQQKKAYFEQTYPYFINHYELLCT